MDAESLRKVRSELTRVAREGETVTYGELGKRVGKNPRNLQPELDKICEEEKAAGCPDLTLVVQKSRDRLPGAFESKQMTAEDWTPDVCERYRERLQEVFDHRRER